jgi:hypothetical protein
LPAFLTALLYFANVTWVFRDWNRTIMKDLTLVLERAARGKKLLMLTPPLPLKSERFGFNPYLHLDSYYLINRGGYVRLLRDELPSHTLFRVKIPIPPTSWKGWLDDFAATMSRPNGMDFDYFLLLAAAPDDPPSKHEFLDLVPQGSVRHVESRGRWSLYERLQ